MKNVHLLQQKLNLKQDRLKSKGYTYNQIVAATQDDFQKWLEEPLSQKSDYMIELNTLIVTKSKMHQTMLESMLDEAIIKNLTLELSDGTILKTESLHVDILNIEDIDNY